MSKFAIEISYNHYKSKLGILIEEAKDEEEARSLAQRHFLNTHPNDSILSSTIIKIDVLIADITNPSHRSPEEKVK